MRRILLPVLMAGFVVVGATGCPDNPYNYTTWTKKLGSRDHERAIQELEQLGDPGAIPALGESWIDQGYPVRDLQVIISLARPLTKAEAHAKFVTDFEETGREPHWTEAMPFLTTALTKVDEANSRSVDNATKAAEALGEAHDPAGLDSLVELANKDMTKKLFQAQIASIRSLGKFENEKGRASAALIKLIDRDPPQHPKTAKSKDEGRALEEKYGMFLARTGAAINALGELQIQTASKTLILSLYRTPELASQIRRALVASGPAAKDELRKVLAGGHAEVEELFKAKRLFEYCGDKGDLPKDQCVQLGLRDFYAALVLGDFYDPKTVPDILAAIKRTPAPAYFVDDQPGPTQMNALFDALRKIGSKEAADPVRAMWMGGAAPAGAKPGPKPPKGPAAPTAPAAGGPVDLPTRILAISAYAFLSRDGQGVDQLAKMAEDNGADDGLRQAAAEAFARLSRSGDDIKTLNKLANDYFKASIKKRAEADGKPKTQADAADKVFNEEKKKNDEAKSNVLKTSRDPNKSAADIKAATVAAKKSDDDFKLAKKKHKEETQAFKTIDRSAKDYKTFARLFQTHIARVEIAIRCKDDITCYAKTLTAKPDEAYGAASKYFKIEIVDKCGKDNGCYSKELQFKPDSVTTGLQDHIKTFSDWSNDEKLGLLEGNVERAMLEIGKKGTAAASLTETLLDNAKSDNRLIRQSILLALPKIAAIPCNTCEAKLDRAIKAGAGKASLNDLNLETTMLRHYFAWAGGKTPTKPSQEDLEDKTTAPAAPKAAPGGKKPAEAAPAEAAPDEAPTPQQPAKPAGKAPAKAPAPAPKKKGK